MTEIKLNKPITIDGQSIATLNMREPTVGDQLAAEKRAGTSGENEVAMFASLCSQSVALIEKISLKDYKKLHKAFADFLS